MSSSTGFGSGTGVGGLVHRTQAVAGEMCVDLGGRQIGVAQQLLHGAQIGTSFEEVRGVHVPQRVRVQRATVGKRVARRGCGARRGASARDPGG